VGCTAVSRVVCLHVLFQILYLDHVEGDGRLLFVYGFAVIRTSESHQMSKNKKGWRCHTTALLGIDRT